MAHNSDTHVTAVLCKLVINTLLFRGTFLVVILIISSDAFSKIPVVLISQRRTPPAVLGQKANTQPTVSDKAAPEPLVKMLTETKLSDVVLMVIADKVWGVSHSFVDIKHFPTAALVKENPGMFLSHCHVTSTVRRVTEIPVM